MSDQDIRAATQDDELARPKPKRRPRKGNGKDTSPGDLARLADFLAYLPEHKFIHRPSGKLWPAAAVNSTLGSVQTRDGSISASSWLDRHQAVETMTWAPGEPAIVRDRLAVQGGWIEHPGSSTYNLYRPPSIEPGDPKAIQPWAEHLLRVYPDDADHIFHWLAHRLQRPGEKLNHALVLGGCQGIGKDTLLEPIRHGVGIHNWEDISPTQAIGRFNKWLISVILRVSEARDLGDVDRFAFHDRMKTYIAAPPETLRIDEKSMGEYYVLNRCGVILTTNHKLDGIYLPPDDRRHYVAWSDATREEFSKDYWAGLWTWYERGGRWNVIAALLKHDLSGFDPKAPPPRTPACEAIIASNHAPEELELSDVLEHLGSPDAITVTQIINAAHSLGLDDLVAELSGSRNARKVPHRLERAGYDPAVNTGSKDRRWKLNGRWVTVYVRKRISVRAQIEAIRSLGINA